MIYNYAKSFLLESLHLHATNTQKKDKLNCPIDYFEKTSMNSIFLDTLKGKTTTRPPVWFMRQAGRALPSYQALKKKHTFEELMHDPEKAADVTLLPVHDLGVDAAILFSDILVIPEALGMQLSFTDKGPQFRNPLKDFSTPAHRLNSDESKLDYIYQTIDKIIAKRPENIPLIGFSGGPFTTFCFMVQGLGSNHTFPDAIQLLYSNPKETIQIFEAITELTCTYAKKQIEHGINAFQLFETHAGLLPESVYDTFVLPSIKKIASVVKDRNIPLIYFPKDYSGLHKITPDIADFISIDWRTDIETARKQIDKNIGLQGNIDPRLLLSSKESINERLQEYKKFGKNNTNWIVNLGHGILPNTPIENIQYTIDWIKNTNWNR